MAAEIQDEVTVPKSTGKAKLDAKPVTVEQPADNTSTDAVAYEAPGTVTVDHLDADVVVAFATPGPVTVTQSWLTAAERKVVTPSKGRHADAAEDTDDAEVK